MHSPKYKGNGHLRMPPCTENTGNEAVRQVLFSEFPD